MIPSLCRALRTPTALASTSSALLVVVTCCYALQPDQAATLTILPPVVWLALGLALVIPAFRARRLFAVLCGLWCAFGIVFVEPVRSTLRPGFRITGPRRAADATIRLVCLNCASSEDAARETARFRPDVVLLQESPPVAGIERIAGDVLGPHANAHAGLDAAILTPVPLRAIGTPPRSANFVMAQARLAGVDMTLVSLRLNPPDPSVDFWRSATRESQARSRRDRRREIETMLGWVRPRADDGSLVIGGDFNAVAGDPALAPMRFLTDSFDAAGRGLCDTVPNDLPFARADRVYVGSGSRVLASSVHRSQHSDHRMLVVDLALRPGAKRDAGRQ